MRKKAIKKRYEKTMKEFIRELNLRLFGINSDSAMTNMTIEEMETLLTELVAREEKSL